jgi:hypothetical protein
VWSRQLAFSPDGRTVACVIRADQVGLWDSRTGRGLHVLRGHEAPISCIAFAPGGDLLASTAGGIDSHSVPHDTTVRLWSVTTGKQLLSLAAARSPVCCAVFSPEGHLLASTSDRGPVRLWEVASGKEVLNFQPQECFASCLAFSEDGKQLASGMSDGTALIWSVLPVDGPGNPPLTRENISASWEALLNADAGKAYRAVCALASNARLTCGFLADRLGAVPVARSDTIRRLIAELNHDLFARREQAGRELIRLGPQVEAELRQATRDRKASVEVRSRIEPLLRTLERWVIADPETLRSLRAVWVLERIGSKDAQELLKRLAGGAPAARQTRAAEAARKRLKRRDRPR